MQELDREKLLARQRYFDSVEPGDCTCFDGTWTIHCRGIKPQYCHYRRNVEAARMYRYRVPMREIDVIWGKCTNCSITFAFTAMPGAHIKVEGIYKLSRDNDPTYNLKILH